MGLKKYLGVIIEQRVKRLKEEADKEEKILDVLGEMNFSNANYFVRLSGERPAIIEHKGTLKKSIEIAEQVFKTENNRSSAQATCVVTVRVGVGVYEVPKKFWGKYREKG